MLTVQTLTKEDYESNHRNSGGNLAFFKNENDLLKIGINNFSNTFAEASNVIEELQNYKQAEILKLSKNGYTLFMMKIPDEPIIPTYIN